MIRKVILDWRCWSIGYRREKWGKVFSVGPVVMSDNTAIDEFEAISEDSEEFVGVAEGKTRAIYLHFDPRSFFVGFFIHRNDEGPYVGKLFPSLLYGPAVFVLGFAPFAPTEPVLFQRKKKGGP